MRHELRVDPIAIDVGLLLQRSIASLYSHLVTRPTGRAVRMAIEAQLAESSRTSLSLIDLSEVAVIDFSCADEVVAKLILHFLEEDRPGDALFVFRGVSQIHREPIEAVLQRQSLLAVAEVSSGQFELLGSRTQDEDHAWSVLETRGRVGPGEVEEVF
ncbi:MAG: hypothetical protein V3T24_13315, partial [Longimicrobiales bacterium]